MTWESFWYRSHSSDGAPPKYRRLCRLDIQTQLDAAIDIAIAKVEGRAGYLQYVHTLTREQYWYWPNSSNEPGDTGWWMIPERIANRVSAVERAAIVCACHLTGGASFEDIAKRLRVWQITGHWRHIIREISPKRETNKHCGSYGDWYQQTFEPRRRRRKAA